MLYNFVFTEFPFKTVCGDVTAFHRIENISMAPVPWHLGPILCSRKVTESLSIYTFNKQTQELKTLTQF